MSTIEVKNIDQALTQYEEFKRSLTSGLLRDDIQEFRSTLSNLKQINECDGSIDYGFMLVEYMRMINGKLMIEIGADIKYEFIINLFLEGYQIDNKDIDITDVGNELRLYFAVK